jgi:hypothetical protein
MQKWRVADDPEASGRIREYLRAIEDDMIAVAAGEELRKHFERLVLDPNLGTAPTGPFERRPVYEFTLKSGDAPRRAYVSYSLSEGGVINILAFSCARIG